MRKTRCMLLTVVPPTGANDSQRPSGTTLGIFPGRADCSSVVCSQTVVMYERLRADRSSVEASEQQSLFSKKLRERLTHFICLDYWFDWLDHWIDWVRSFHVWCLYDVTVMNAWLSIKYRREWNITQSSLEIPHWHYFCYPFLYCRFFVWMSTQANFTAPVLPWR